jgi:hypothetical protein
VRWIFTVAFQANLGGAHGRGEGANDREGARTGHWKARTGGEGGAYGFFFEGGERADSFKRGAHGRKGARTMLALTNFKVGHCGWSLPLPKCLNEYIHI